jgi:phytol kinase
LDFSQTFVGFVVLALFSLLWNKWNIPQELMYMTILTTTLGDGLAEPVGVRFSKHKYAVKGFLSIRHFTAALEGNLVVYFFALILALFFIQNFHGVGWAMMVILFPLAMTLTVKSPHTWDTHFCFLLAT